jgi:hypothetical protein
MLPFVTIYESVLHAPINSLVITHLLDSLNSAVNAASGLDLDTLE